MQLAITAKLVECGEPAAERSGILIPADARVVFEKLRGIVAEQMVRVHGECSQAIASAGELYGFGRGVGHNSSPQRLLLERAKHHAAIDFALIPGRASKTLPILNVRSGPCGQPFSTAGAMKGRGEGSRRALAGSDHDSAAAQPRIDLYRGLFPPWQRYTLRDGQRANRQMQAKDRCQWDHLYLGVEQSSAGEAVVK